MQQTKFHGQQKIQPFRNTFLEIHKFPPPGLYFYLTKPFVDENYKADCMDKGINCVNFILSRSIVFLSKAFISKFYLSLFWVTITHINISPCNCLDISFVLRMKTWYWKKLNNSYSSKSLTTDGMMDYFNLNLRTR